MRTSPQFEIFLAGLYTDEALLARFKSDTQGEALRAGLSAEEAAALSKMNLADLEDAAHSITAKRLKRVRVHSLRATS